MLHGFKFDELLTAEGIARLDQQFITQLPPTIASQLQQYRQGDITDAVTISHFLLQLSPLLEVFLADLYDIHAPLAALNDSLKPHNQVAQFKKDFILRRVRHYRQPIELSFAELDIWLNQQIIANNDPELAIANYWLTLNPDTDPLALDRLMQWCYLTLNDPQSPPMQQHWTSFQLPQKIDYTHLVPLIKQANNTVTRLQAEHCHQRDGFKLTDLRASARHALDEVNYCVYCHEQAGDFCSKGFPKKKKAPKQGLKVNPLGETLTGCPLEEKISEMHWLKRECYSIAALAIIVADNPMVPATGHRICNDCMKACIYQKQTPVDIPQAETRILTDVLNLPWGVEIYDLLTRWNPLRQTQYCLQPYNGHNVLVAGLGPAGFSMVHHLTMSGCSVVGIDGLKIEPLPPELLTQPIQSYQDLIEPLDQRITWGFGGVSEYGITVRWDKNFLKLIYLTLSRRQYFNALGGVRLGGTITLENAWALGFHHVCIATGAGLPRVIPMGNSLAKGMRQASDFLMTLQLTGAAKADSLANLQVRLPAVVIGGGLTAIDTATEIQPYYIAQVEKILYRYEILVETYGEEHLLSGMWMEEQREVLNEFLAHGRAIRAERQRAKAANETPQLLQLIQQWGGVTVIYRRHLNESPAYLRNHEEVIKAMEEGIYYIEGLEPVHAKLDQYGHVAELICQKREKSDDGRWLNSQQQSIIPAKAIMVAAGATPNTIYEHEYPGTFALEHDHFVPHICHTDELQPVQVANHCKSPEFGPFTSYFDNDNQAVTFIGDTHPVFHGSVVKAIASAKRTYPAILKALSRQPKSQMTADDFLNHIQDQLTATVAEIRLQHPAVAEIIIRAPLAARNFKAGQIYRLQTFEQYSHSIQNNRLQIPPMTVSGAGIIDNDKVRLMVLQGGGAGPKLASQLQPGDPLILMGPTGAPIDIPQNKTVLVIAGQWGASVMLDLGPTLRNAGNTVLYFAAYRQAKDVYPQQELEQAADQIVWCSAEGDLIRTQRPQDQSVAGGNMIELLQNYGQNTQGIPLSDVDHIMIMGSTGLLKGMASALKGNLKNYFKPSVHAAGTVGSPMQCMLKGVCGQCLQWQINPETGKRTKAVFACAMQDQPLFWIDLDNLQARQSQNYLPEYLTSQWLNHLLNT